ncbi:hypothetical protein AMS68_001220 [Peltaster fructicola]|uniref:Cyclin-like domain-containing protein n=1 Tax=Peltaster fructicola TaxID=286661 RepID=A0A6H0XLV9_9PEZI|nr:hypothetical protein AMS68_001220 [Peltaster fructicola]
MPPVGAPRRLTGRLDTLNRSTLGRRQPIQQNVVKKACCDEPKIEEEDGAKVCKNCYTQISESNIVSDITFQEDSRGAATVQGGFIGENARHARTLGSAAYRRVGGEKNSIQEIEANGRRELASLCPRLSIPETWSMQAAAIWSLAAKQNFTAGRRTDEVIAACLYAACRRQKENTVLLMDISEQQKINVFRLGEVYKDLCKALFLENDNLLGFQRLVEIEPLVLKYCRNLEFGEMTRSVAEDAVKIVRRMKRDWIVTGRHPAGLCGGAIILAASMNNFRRSVREVVYVAKVADATISKRMEEFRRTQSAALTVDQFREFGTKLKGELDPPSLHLSEERQQKHEARKRKRQEYHERRESSVTTTSSTPAPSEDEGEEPQADPEQSGTTNVSTPPSMNTAPRIDADGFAIPGLPASASIDNGSEAPSVKKKSKKEANRPEPVTSISPEELAEEQELEHEIEEVLEDPAVIETRNEIARAKAEERARLLADEQKVVDAGRIKARRESQGITWFNDNTTPGNEEITADDLEAEFANDPEVMNCMLSSEEIRLKEKIWVAFNEDWLRTQHEKELLAKINEASGKKDPNKKTKGKKKKRSKMGDGTLLAEANTPIETPADANAAMLAKRAPVAFSRYVNYEALSKVYGGTSRANSEAPSVSSRAASPTSTAAGSPEPERRVTFAPVTSPTSRRPVAPKARKPVQTTTPATPPPTQPQTAEGAPTNEEEGEDYDEDNDFNDEYNDYSTSMFGTGHDDREDIGEDDYSAALDELGGAAMDEDYY